METSEQAALPDLGVGITNLVARPTAAASDLRPEELRAGALILERTVERLQPKCVAVLGMQAFRTAFAQPKATIGPQPERLAQSEVWLLPNPSGLQARYQMPEMVGFFRDLHRASR
jgi:TDG/mug DNA glycosylase family protein